MMSLDRYNFELNSSKLVGLKFFYKLYYHISPKYKLVHINKNYGLIKIKKTTSLCCTLCALNEKDGAINGTGADVSSQ